MTVKIEAYNAVFLALVVKRSAKTVTVRVPTLLYGVVSWSRLRLPANRVDVAGTPVNARNFEIATNEALTLAYAREWNGAAA